MSQVRLSVRLTRKGSREVYNNFNSSTDDTNCMNTDLPRGVIGDINLMCGSGLLRALEV